MKLAIINPDGSAKCTVCTWSWKVGNKRKKKGCPDRILTPEERFNILELNILAHLRDAHDRVLVTRDVFDPPSEGSLSKAYYNGQRVGRVKWEKLW